jgi:subtilisin family serine protease
MLPYRRLLVTASALAGLSIGTALADDGIANLKAASGSAAARTLAAKAERGGARVIVTVTSAPATAQGAAPKGAMPLEDYIDSLQTHALQSLGWVNFNDIIKFQYSPAMALSVDGARLTQLMASGEISGVYEDKPNKAFLMESVPLIGASAARRDGASGAGIAVAVLDTGVDNNHPFLSAKIAEEACFSTAQQVEGGTQISACPGGAAEAKGKGAAKPCDGGEACGHGTHVAGIVAGRSPHFVGVAPDTTLLAAQVFSLMVQPNGSKAPMAMTSDVIRALEWVYSLRDRYKIAAINLSLGGGQFSGACDADNEPYLAVLKLLRQANIAVVVAAGNEGFTNSLASPACISQVVSVGAIDNNDSIPSFSNGASFLTFLAPGIDKAVGGTGIHSSIPGGGFARMPGTSMAAPHVAGAFAALKSAMPDATLGQILDALKKSGKSVRDSRNGLSTPRIRIDMALELLKTGAVSAEPAPQPNLPPPDPAPRKPNPQPREERPRHTVKPVPERGGNDDGIGRW